MCPVGVRLDNPLGLRVLGVLFRGVEDVLRCLAVETWEDVLGSMERPGSTESGSTSVHKRKQVDESPSVVTTRPDWSGPSTPTSLLIPSLDCSGGYGSVEGCRRVRWKEVDGYRNDEVSGTTREDGNPISGPRSVGPRTTGLV